MNNTAAVLLRLEAFRCYMLRRGVRAPPVLNKVGRSAPPGPGACDPLLRLKTDDGRLNVLMVAADDLRPQLNTYMQDRDDYPYAGKHAKMITPHLDALANRSTVFLKSYCQQAICMATRASILTGRRPDTTNITGQMQLSSYWRTLGGNFTSLPQHFRNSGFDTFGMGKIFHPGACSGGIGAEGGQNPGPSAPWSSGDDWPYSWTLTDPELPGYFHAPNKMYYQCSAKPGYNHSCPPGGFQHRTTPSFRAINRSEEAAAPPMDQQIADNAIKTLQVLGRRRARDAASPPWFVAVGFHLPHLPELVPERFVQLYDTEDVQTPDNGFAPDGMPTVAWSSYGELLGQYSDARLLKPLDGKARGSINSTLPPAYVKSLRQHYYGAVSYVDSQLGRVLSAVKESGFEDETAVAVWGDHGYQLGEHGEWCKITNFELAAHTVLIMHAPGLPAGRSRSFVEFVDIFPTLSDVAGIAVPPLCPVDSKDITLCTEGTSLRKVLADSRAEVKKASFTQYPRTYRAQDRSEYVLALSAEAECSASAVGAWHEPVHGNIFVIEQGAGGAVALNTSGCHDCGFSGASGRLTAGGVDLTLRFKPPSKEVDAMVGTLSNRSCELSWTTNSTSVSGHWPPFFRAGAGPSPAPPPAPAGEYMGYSMVTIMDEKEIRYTEWAQWSEARGVDWAAPLAGHELYDHSVDPEENRNAVAEAPAALVAALRKQLRQGWRAASLKTDDRGGFRNGLRDDSRARRVRSAAAARARTALLAAPRPT